MIDVSWGTKKRKHHFVFVLRHSSQDAHQLNPYEDCHVEKREGVCHVCTHQFIVWQPQSVSVLFLLQCVHTSVYRLAASKCIRPDLLPSIARWRTQIRIRKYAILPRPL